MESQQAPLRVARYFFICVAALCVAAIVFLAGSVARDLSELRSAKRDSVQWTLSQVEIEFLDLNLTLEKAVNSQAPELRGLRKDFDVFYSRVAILSEGTLFTDARIAENFRVPVDRIVAFLDQNVALMDGSDANLVENLDQLLRQTQNLRPSVRGLYVAGLGYFAEQADLLRNRLANTMLELSAASGLLLILLAILTLYSRATNKQLRDQRFALVVANARMQTILSTSLDGVIVSDYRGRILDFNEAAERIFGYRFEDVKGELIGDLIVPPELRDAHQQGMDRIRAGGQRKLVGQGHIQIDACRADGSLFPVELALESATAEDGDIIIAFLRDISQRVQNETDLRHARDAALAGEKAKAEFLAVMSHEIRTPLNGLLGNLTLLGDTRLTREQKQLQGNMDISGRQLMKHVNSVLDIARFESGKMPVRRSRFHLGEMLQEIVDGQSSRAENQQTALAWRWVGRSVDWIMSDRSHIEQILLNLVGNAIKVTEGGRVEIEAEILGEELEFRVIDTGVGIAESDQASIFEDFETTGGQSGGTGLGLGIVRRLVGLLKGELGVESTLGEGSVFWVRLPLQVAEAPSETIADATHLTPQGGLRILLAEDNEMNAFVAQKMLEKDLHHVTVVEDGLLALEAVKAQDFDVVLMDINMPRMDGLTATQQIRALPGHAKSIPIFAFSANVLPDDKDRFWQNGMDGFIGKPIQIEELRGALALVATGDLRGHAPAENPHPATQDARDLMGDNFASFLQRFIDESDALAAWIAQGETPADEVEHRCHKLFSTAALFGAKSFQAALRDAETAAKNTASDLRLEAVSKAWEEARAELLQELS